MFTFDPESSYMMPAHFGPRPVPPDGSWRYHDVTALTVSYLTDPQRLAGHLPSPFEVGEEARITVSCIRNGSVDWLAGHGYNMLAVNAGATFRGAHDRLWGTYSLVIWESLTDPILTGRELQGIPKIYADIPDPTEHDGVWRATASHFGHTFADMEVSGLRAPTAAEIEEGMRAQAGSTAMGWRHLPGVGGPGATVSEPTAFPSQNELTSVLVGEGRIDWHELTWEQNPTQFHIVNALAALPALEWGPALLTEGGANLAVADDPPRVIS